MFFEIPCPEPRTSCVVCVKMPAGMARGTNTKETDMSDYLFLIRNAGNPMEQMSPEQMQGHLDEWSEWMGGLAAEGRLISAKPLAQAARCVRKEVVVDGPYAEAKDVVGGDLLVRCDSMEHAIEVARRCPVVALGSLVEVRETEPNILE